MCDGLEAGHEHAGKTDSGEITDVADHFLIVAQRDLELIPDYFLCGLIIIHYHRHLLVGDIVFADYKVFGPDRNFILEIAFIFIQRVVLIDVLHIRKRT